MPEHVREIIYIDGVEVGRTTSLEDEKVGARCQGYFFKGLNGVVSIDLEDPNAPGADLTEFDDGSITVEVSGRPEDPEIWIALLEDVITKIRKEMPDNDTV